jgi:hypothetical protein
MQSASIQPCNFENEPFVSKDQSPNIGYITFPAFKGMPRTEAGFSRGVAKPVPVRVIGIWCVHDALFTQDDGDQGRLRAVNGAAA